MFKEILQIQPRVSTNDLNKMERSLSQRFQKVAKGFGKGLTGSLMGGGIAGAALGLIDKLLNPLQETQEAINRTLSTADDIADAAKQFNTTSSNLARLQAFGEAAGLDPESLRMMMQKFQVAVAEASADPNKGSAVRQYVGDKDTAESFFQFIQSLKQMTRDQQVLIQQEVFGEKQILKMSDFLNQDFKTVAKRLGIVGKPADELEKGINKGSDLKGTQDLLAAKRKLDAFEISPNLITEGMLKAEDQRERQRIDRENIQMQGYHAQIKLAMASDQMLGMMQRLLTELASGMTKFYDIHQTTKKFEASPLFRGILKVLGGG